MTRSNARPQHIAEAAVVVLLGFGFATAQVLIGGTRLVFSLPAYGIIAIAAVLALVSFRRTKPKPDVLCLLSSALFFGYVAGRALLSPVPYVAQTDLYIVLGSLLVYGITVTVFTEAKTRLIFLGFLLLGALVQVGIGAIQFRDGANFMLIPFLQRADYGRRASGFYVCPNHLAGLLEVIGIFGISAVCWSRIPVWLKLFVGYASGICYAGAILTGSRGGYLSIAASFLVLATLSLLVLRGAGGSLPWKVAAFALLFAFVAAGVTFFSVRKSNFLTDRAGNIADVSNVRFDLWHAAIEQWKLAPVLGTGGATYRYYGRKFRTPAMQMDPVEVHNDYLQLLCEYGAVGAIAFASFLALHLRAGWRAFRVLGPRRAAVASRLLSNNLALNAGALAAVAAYLVHSAFDFNLHIPANALLLAFVFGILANPGARRAGEPETPGQLMLLSRLAVATLGVVLLAQSARLFPGAYYAERARMALRSDEPAAAIWYASEALSHAGKNPDAFAYLGRARLGYGYDAVDPRVRASFYGAAIAAFDSARALAPMEETFPMTLGLLYDLLGRFPEGEWMLGLAVSLDPKSEAVRQYYQAHLTRWRNSGAATAGALQPDAGSKQP